MDTFLKKIDDTLNSGDEELRKWFLIRQKYLPFVLCGCYVLFSTTIGPALMRKRKPFNLRALMVFFNLFLVATYTTTLTIAFWYLLQLPREIFCKGTNVKKGDITYTLASLGWIIYMLKYIEFLDTVFFILRKKESQITVLHIVHHTIVPILGWIGFRTEKSGMQTIPVIINCIVHVIMYSYYGLSAMGPSVRKYLWWKKYLTQLQIIQFFLIILFVTIVAPVSGCRMVVSGYIMDLVFAPFFLYLFYKFYKIKFKSEGKSTETNGNTRNASFTNEAIKNDICANGNKESCMLIKDTSKKE